MSPQEKTKIIGLSGKGGVGKTTLANYLVENYNFKKVSFAEPLRNIAKQLFSFSDIELSGVRQKEKPFRNYEWSPRDFMINLGAFMRYHDKDYWLRQGLLQLAQPNKYVIDDVRFPNEVEGIKALGGKIVRINRYEKDCPYPFKDIESETALDNFSFDFVIEDCENTTLKDLYKRGDRIAKEL